MNGIFAYSIGLHTRKYICHWRSFTMYAMHLDLLFYRKQFSRMTFHTFISLINYLLFCCSLGSVGLH
ncbi:hypothetical protein BDA96_04G144600 [Sorghum bicolor]|uniref:Uncharacterized protein n=2 Tax=Sorghum bicolor TaxID=4558 RepID=A0A1Z5RMR8_SORBI|nr:hypothetical protein BDA96_04G144600 [Sorghum bicolor]OQU84871.1 hypothetical protein SORBI_3004G135333 [Sorghum bicolor]